MIPEKNRLVPGAVLIGALTLVAYVPALRGDFVWDDDAYITNNRTLTAPDGLYRIWAEPSASPQYYPLVFTTFWVEQRLWGMNPVGFHLVNCLLHAAGAVLLWRILRRLNVHGGYFASLIFALHPVHVESVAWITERKNVLSGVFYLSALIFYLRFADLPAAQAPQRPRWGRYVLALLLFLAALLSKSVTASLPAAILLIVWWKRDRLAKRDVLPLVPLFVLGLAMGLTTAWLERHVVGTVRFESGYTKLDRVLLAGRALWFYLGKLLWPHPLIFNYPRWAIDSLAITSYLYPAAMLIFIAALWTLRNRLGKGPLVAILFFVGTLVPALGFVDIYFAMMFSPVADHFQYLASIGPIAFAAALLARVKLSSRQARATVAAAILLPLGILTWRQSRIYDGLESLWRDTLKKNDNAWMAHNNLAVFLHSRNKLDEAAHHFLKAIDLNPRGPSPYNGLADLRLQQGQIDVAADLIDRALKADPLFPMTHYHLGMISHLKHRPEEAIQHFHRALEIKPDLADAHCDLAVLLHERGDVNEALANYEMAIEEFTSPYDHPRKNLALCNAASILTRQGRIDDAIEHYRQAIQIMPDDAETHLSLAQLLFKRHDLADAAHHFEQSVHLSPKNAQARYNLGVALSELGRWDDAINSVTEALRIKPDYLEARYGLARLLEARGRTSDALREYESILRDHPDHADARQRIAALRDAGDSTTRPHEQKTDSRPSD